MDNYCSKLSDKNFEFKNMLDKPEPDTSIEQLEQNKEKESSLSNDTKNVTNTTLTQITSDMPHTNCYSKLEELEMICNEALGAQQEEKIKIQDIEVTPVSKHPTKFEDKTDEVSIDCNEAKTSSSKTSEVTLVPKTTRKRKYKCSETDLTATSAKKFKRSVSETTLVNEASTSSYDNISLPSTYKTDQSVANQRHDKDVLEIMHGIDNMDEACIALRKENNTLWDEIEKLAYYAMTNKSKTDIEIQSDINFLQAEINKLKGEVNTLRVRGGKNKTNPINCKTEDTNLEEILKMNPFLKEEQLRNYEDLKDYVSKLEEKAQASKDKTHDLLNKLEEQTEYMHTLQEKIHISMFTQESSVTNDKSEVPKEILKEGELPNQILLAPTEEDSAGTSGNDSKL